MSIKAMRERRSALAVQAKQLMDETKDTSWSSEHQAKYDELVGEIDNLDTKMARHQAILDKTAEDRFNEEDLEAGARAAHDAGKPSAARALINAWLRNGVEGLSAEQMAQYRNTMSTTTGSQGGFTVPTEVATSVINALKAYGGMRDVASHLVTTDGRPLNYSTTDGTSEEGEVVPENTPAGSQDVSFGTAALNVFKYSSKIITVPIELMNDSAINIEDLVRQRIQTRLGRITNRHFTVGAGTTEPLGVVTASSVGKTGATGQTVSITYDDLADLAESVDQAYLDAGTGTFMFHQQMRRVLRKLKDANGRPIWTPDYDMGVTDGVGDTLLGFKVKINNHMPVPAANAKSIAFGDFSKYMIRDAMDIMMLRFADSAFLRNGQIGFLAWMRCGGNLLDTSAVKLYQHSAT